MPYTLKKTSAPFDMVDGEMAGRKFRHGVEYTEIPQAYADRFESVGATGGSPVQGNAQPEKLKKRRETVMPDAAETKEE